MNGTFCELDLSATNPAKGENKAEEPANAARRNDE